MTRHSCEDAVVAVPGSGLDELVVGRTYKATVDVGATQVMVALRHTAGHSASVTFDGAIGLDDYAPPVELRSVISILIQYEESSLKCSVLGTSSDGPKRVDVDVAQALALAAKGTHTVVRVG